MTLISIVIYKQMPTAMAISLLIFKTNSLFAKLIIFTFLSHLSFIL